MILNHFAKMIIDLSKKEGLRGEAFCYGDQKISFSREYIESGFSSFTDIDYNAQNFPPGLRPVVVGAFLRYAEKKNG